MSKHKTIAFFSGYFIPFLGGIERYTDKLTEELVKLGYRIVIVTTKHDEALPDVAENNGRTIYRLPSKKLFQQRYPLLDRNATYKRLMASLDDEGIDYVICNTRFHLTTPLGLRFAKKHHLPSLVIDHGSSHFTVNNPILDFFGAIYEHLLTVYVKRLTSNFYAVSQRSSEWLKHFNIKSKGEIYNSVPKNLAEMASTKGLLEKASDDIIITYAGRILKEKGIEVLLQAFEESHFSKNIHLVIAGDGPLLDDVKGRYASGNVQFLGKLNFEDTMTVMAQSDIFVYPSMYPEGLPTSILEAGLLGAAIIATDRGGTVEVINSPELGIIMEETVSSLKIALEELVTDDERRQKLQKAIQQRIANHFTWTQTAKTLDEILKSF